MSNTQRQVFNCVQLTWLTWDSCFLSFNTVVERKKGFPTLSFFFFVRGKGESGRDISHPRMAKVEDKLKHKPLFLNNYL